MLFGGIWRLDVVVERCNYVLFHFVNSLINILICGSGFGDCVFSDGRTIILFQFFSLVSRPFPPILFPSYKLPLASYLK